MSKGIFLHPFVIRNQGDIDREVHETAFDLDYHIKSVIASCGVTLDCECSDCGQGFGVSQASKVAVPTAAPEEPMMAMSVGAQTVTTAHPEPSADSESAILREAINQLVRQIAVLQDEVNALKANLPLDSLSLFSASLVSLRSFSLITGICTSSNGYMSKYFCGTCQGMCGR